VGCPSCSGEYFGRHFEHRRRLDEALLATQGVAGDVISGRKALERGLQGPFRVPKRFPGAHLVQSGLGIATESANRTEKGRNRKGEARRGEAGRAGPGRGGPGRKCRRRRRRTVTKPVTPEPGARERVFRLPSYLEKG
jgi:hypothetical protein